jgi:hypothetical protein
MATPHASAVLALIASKYPNLRHHPEALVLAMKLGALRIGGNTMPPLSATDLSAGDLAAAYPNPCVAGYCHLRGAPISDLEAYGAGLVDALRPISAGH